MILEIHEVSWLEAGKQLLFDFSLPCPEISALAYEISLWLISGSLRAVSLLSVPLTNLCCTASYFISLPSTFMLALMFSDFSQPPPPLSASRYSHIPLYMSACRLDIERDTPPFQRHAMPAHDEPACRMPEFCLISLPLWRSLIFLHRR